MARNGDIKMKWLKRKGALHELSTLYKIKHAGTQVIANKSSNIGKTTTTNQYRRVPDLWRPGSVKIKRYYTKNDRLTPTAMRGKENKAVKLKRVQYICPIFRFEKQTFYGG